jgi:poly(3-hydroxybutyrate) depolymerase
VLDMDADYYLETIETVFQKFKLVEGTWDVKGVNGKVERVRPEAITSASLLTIEGELDDISGSGQTEAAHDLCSNIPKAKRQHFEVKGAGHYGIFSGSRWRNIVYPKVRDFILAAQKANSALGTKQDVLASQSQEPVRKVANAKARTAPKPKAAATSKATRKPAAPKQA